PRQAVLAQQNVMIDLLREENKERLESLNNTIKLLDVSKEQLKTEQDKINAQKFIQAERDRLSLAESLSAKESEATQKKSNDYLDKSLEKQTLLRIAAENSLYLSQDENLTC